MWTSRLRLTSLVLPQQVMTRSGGYLEHSWEELGERKFSFDSLKSRLNCNMDEKGIVRAVRQLRRGSFDGSPAAPAGGAQRQFGSSGGGSSAAVRQLCRTPCQVVKWQSDKLHLLLYEIPCFWNARTSQLSARPLVHKIVYLSSDWRGMGKWVIIFKCAPLQCRRGRQNWLAHSKKHVRTYVELCMRVAATETQNNSEDISEIN